MVVQTVISTEVLEVVMLALLTNKIPLNCSINDYAIKGQAWLDQKRP